MSTAMAENSLLRASAGTGKTFQLTNRLLGLCCAGSAPEQLLATTFTRKAAAEILDRAMTRLSAAGRDPAACARLADEIGAADLTPARALELLGTLLKNLDRLRVMTLDSFFAQVAGRFALELGLPPGWSIADELTDAQLRSEAIEAVLSADGDGQVERLLGLMTKGEAQRSVSQLLRDAVRNLYSAFRETNREAWRWLPQPRPLTAEELSGTIAEIAAAVLPDDPRMAKARDRDVLAAQAEDWKLLIGAGLIKRILAGETSYYKKPIPPPLVARYQALLRHVRALELLRLAHQMEATAELLSRFDRQYADLKRRRRLLRFEDITAAVAEGAAVTGRGALAWRLDADVANLLLDEFQDTSLPQWQALRPLAQRAAGSPGRSFFCVGDVKQAIYGWRGGVPEIFDALTAQLPGLSSRTLSTSYRSAPVVIDAVNQIFSPRVCTGHDNLQGLEPAVAQWCRNFPLHSTAKTELAGYVALMTAPAASDEDASPGQDPDAEREAAGAGEAVTTIQYAAEHIARLADLVRPRTVGVLLRKNESVARMIFELRKRHVDASEEGGNPLTDSAAVGAVLSLLRLADHPGDRVAAFHVAHSPLGKQVGLSVENHAIENHTAENHTAENYAAAVGDLARKLRDDLMTDGYGRTIRSLTEQLASSCSPRDLDRLRQLTEMACQYDARATLRSDDFVEFVQQTRVPRTATAQVRVMTIHQAKGLEFDAVVLPELDANLLGQPPAFVAGRSAPGEPIDRVCLYRGEEVRPLLPDEARKLFDENTRQRTDEAMSLLYVMVTRPIHALYLIVKPSQQTKRQRLPRTFAGLLRAALTDGGPLPPRQTIFELGDPQWYLHAADHAPRAVSTERTVSTERAVSTDHAAAEVPPLEVWLAPPGETARRRLVPRSPSQLEGGPRLSAVDLLRIEGGEARRRGRLMHAWFELIEWLDDSLPGRGEPDDELLRRAAMRCDAAEPGPGRGGADGADDAELTQWIAEFRTMLGRRETADALRAAGYRSPQSRPLAPAVLADLSAAATELVVRRERAIVARDGDNLLSGQVDRLVLVMRGGVVLWADVIDFKSDRLERGNAAACAAKGEFYRPQVEAYRRAVSRMFHVAAERVTARLLLVEPGVVVEM